MTIVDNGFSATRRLVLRGAATVALVGLGNIPCDLALAAANEKYPEDAFKAKGDADAIKALYGRAAEPSDKVKLDAPEIAENGAVVPIEITSKVPGTTSIVVLIEKNPFPLLGKFDFMEGALPFVKVNVKMGETSDVRVIAQAGGKSYVATREVKVTIGGCGG
jgi:sulfur-oxidizing protein SoxY